MPNMPPGKKIKGMKYYKSLVQGRKVKSFFRQFNDCKFEIGDIFKVIGIEDYRNICFASCETLDGQKFWVENKRLKTSGEFVPISEKEYMTEIKIKKLKE